MKNWVTQWIVYIVEYSAREYIAKNDYLVKEAIAKGF